MIKACALCPELLTKKSGVFWCIPGISLLAYRGRVHYTLVELSGVNPKTKLFSPTLSGAVLILSWAIGLYGEESYTEKMESHFLRMFETGRDVHGSDTNAMWMSVLETRTGQPPEIPRPSKRVYRAIGAPNGTTFYWDQPLVVAAPPAFA